MYDNMPDTLIDFGNNNEILLHLQILIFIDMSTSLRKHSHINMIDQFYTNLKLEIA